MANKTDRTSLFRVIALIFAVVLVVAATLAVLPSGDVRSASEELAALSQAIPQRAEQALRGESGGFDALGASVERVNELMRSPDGEASGDSDDWRSAVRGRYEPGDQYSDLGFRVVLSLTP